MSKQLSPVDDLKKTFGAMKDQFKLALPKHISADKFVRVLTTAVSSNPTLAEANRNSLLGACMKSAQDGLIPDGKEAAIVIYNTKAGKVAQYMPMVSGILKKVRNSGELASITAQIVHEKDQFKYWIDSQGEHIEHTPNMFGDRGKRIGVYALAKTKDNAVYIEVMTEEQIQAVRNASRSKDSGPWAGAFVDEMVKKSAIRRLSKRLPMSTDLEMTINADDDLYDFSQEDTPMDEEKTVSPEKPKDKTKPNKLKDIIQNTESEELDDSDIIDITSTPDNAISEEDAPI